VGTLFTTVSSIRVSRVGSFGRVRVTLTVTVRVSRVRFSFKGFAIFPIFSTWQHT